MVLFQLLSELCLSVFVLLSCEVAPFKGRSCQSNSTGGLFTSRCWQQVFTLVSHIPYYKRKGVDGAVCCRKLVFKTTICFFIPFWKREMLWSKTIISPSCKSLVFGGIFDQVVLSWSTCHLHPENGNVIAMISMIMLRIFLIRYCICSLYSRAGCIWSRWRDIIALRT